MHGLCGQVVNVRTKSVLLVNCILYIDKIITFPSAFYLTVSVRTHLS